MKQILERLSLGEELNSAEAKEILLKITSGAYSNEQVAAFLMALNMRPIVVAELIGFREAMIEQALRVDLADETIDIVGTGGDGKNTFNISTCTAMVVAGAGFKVAKHGSYAVSSVSGSANVLLELGLKFTNQREVLQQCLDEANFCFIHAPLFHPAMKHVVPIRRALKVRTVFNILGPLIHPGNTTYGVYGVYKEELAKIYAKVFAESGIKFSIIHNLDGYDELSLTDTALIVNENGSRKMEPSDFSCKRIQPSSIFGGSNLEEAASIFYSVLENRAIEEQKNVVMINAALAIQLARPDLDIIECKEIARESIESGAAMESLKKVASITKHIDE